MSFVVVGVSTSVLRLGNKTAIEYSRQNVFVFMARLLRNSDKQADIFGVLYLDARCSHRVSE